MNIRLQNLVIPARHFEQTVRFYRDTLRLEVAQQGEGFCFLKASGVRLAIHRTDESNPLAPTGNGIYLDFVVESVLQTKRWLESAGVAIRREWRDANRKYLLVADPEGNLMQFIEPLKSGT
jgi:predicted enzyme related to lactoylglutathione lyase